MNGNMTHASRREVLSMSPRLLVVVLSIGGNLLILHVIRKSRHFSEVTRHLISHLAVADILYSFLMCLHLCFLMAGVYRIHAACIVIMGANAVCGINSCWGICLVFLDNYFSFRRINEIQRAGLTLKQARICIVSGWSVGGIYGVVFLIETPKNSPYTDCRLGGSVFTEFSLTLMGICLAVMCVLVTVSMFATVRIVQRRMQAVFPEQREEENNRFSLTNFLRREHMKRRAKITRVFTIITVGFLLSYVPLMIGIFLTIGVEIDAQTLATLVSFTMLNACFNVIVYIIRDNAFRKEVRQRIPCLRERVNNRVDINLITVRSVRNTFPNGPV